MENTQGRGRQQRGTEVTELRDTFDFYLKVLAACSHGLNEDGKGNTGRNIAIKKKKKAILELFPRQREFAMILVCSVVSLPF